MNRILTILSLLACTLMAQAQVITTKVEQSTAEDYVLLLKKQGYQSYSVDVSALQNETYIIEPVVKHYKNGKEAVNPFDFGVAFTSRDALTVCDRIRVGFMPGEMPAVVMMSFYVTETGALTIPLVFDERKDPETGEVEKSYGYRPFTIDGIELGKFIPVALCGAYWYDKKGGFFRFCGENSISPAMSEDILKSIEEYYIVGMIIKKQ